MIKDLLNKWSKVNLFTRPRRFGKSLNMSMLKCFLEIGCDKTLFERLAISKETSLCETYMGHFPVLSISLKGVSGADFAAARSLLCSTIGNEAMRFQFLLGILGYKNDWYVKSNRESGDGYSDILIKIDSEKIGIIIEVKYAENAQYDSVCRDALRQIKENAYTRELLDSNFSKILSYAIACFRKECRVMLEII